MKFKVGDKVRVVETKHDCKKHLIGKDFIVKKPFKGVGDNYVYDVGEEYLLNEPELELFTSKFKVGDTVRVIAANSYQDESLVGNTYTVTIIQDNMEWYHLDEPHRYAWHEEELELVKPKFNHKDYPGKYAMHVTTAEQADIFVKYMTDVMDLHWCDNCFYCYEKKTCYFFNEDCYADTPYCCEKGYTILEFEDFDWSDFTMKKEFTKADLKNGDVIMKRNGAIEIVCVDTGTLIYDKGANSLANINNDLTSLVDRTYDIVAVRRPCCFRDCCFSTFKHKMGELVYERKEVEEMTLEEVCKALGKEIKIVKK